MELIERLQWRYATKRMTGTKIDQDKVDRILEAIRLSASSMGLQPYTILVVKDRNLLKQIKPIANNQPQIEECSHLLIFAAWSNILPAQVDTYISEIADVRGVALETLNDYKSRLLGITSKNSQEQNNNWAIRQTYIAFGTGIVAAAFENVDATPMEGFDKIALDKLLNLKEKGLQSVTLLPLGYRDIANDWLAKYPKVRRNKNELFEVL